MDPNKDTSSEENTSQQDDAQQLPADALSMSPDELETEKSSQAAQQAAPSDQPAEKKISPIKRFFKKVNLYFLLFLLIIVIAGVVTAVNYLNSQKEAPEATIPTQQLSEEALKDLANNDASVGSSSQTLTIQGSAIISGETLIRKNLSVAGNIQAGGKIQGSSVSISGESSFGATQLDSLQVSQNAAIQGNTTVRNLNVSGNSSFKGALTASKITVSELILSGNASLQIPNHISFTGPAPSRSIDSGVLGSGGSASVNGSDTTGTVNIRTGNGPSTGCFVRISFAQAFSNSPHVLVSPVGSGAGRTEYYVDRDTSGFSICAASPAPANQTFAYDYFVTN